MRAVPLQDLALASGGAHLSGIATGAAMAAAGYLDGVFRAGSTGSIIEFTSTAVSGAIIGDLVESLPLSDTLRTSITILTGFACGALGGAIEGSLRTQTKPQTHP